jgi:hypothetical protein
MRQTTSRLIWFVGLWAAGVLTVALLGYAIRLILA